MNILITGSTGFVGRYVVGAALDAGHQVRAVVRPSSSGSSLAQYLDHPSLEIARVDLRSRAQLDGALTGIDSVIHLAAAKAGDFYTQFAGTVVATENLLAAMNAAGVQQLVGVSTFSVYDYLAMSPGELLTESSPIDDEPALRDEYARTKLIQEDLYRNFAPVGGRSDNRLLIIRPGMIYGRDNLWHSLLGAEMGPRFIKIGSKATLPLCYVENCADALVLAAEGLDREPSLLNGEVINLVDDGLPSQASYIDQVSRVIDPPPSFSVPWPVMRTAANMLGRSNKLLVDGRAKFPGIVVADRLHARFKPLNYSNAKAKRLLNWKPRYSTSEAIRRSVEPEAPADSPLVGADD